MPATPRQKCVAPQTRESRVGPNAAPCGCLGTGPGCMSWHRLQVPHFRKFRPWRAVGVRVVSFCYVRTHPNRPNPVAVCPSRPSEAHLASYGTQLHTTIDAAGCPLQPIEPSPKAVLRGAGANLGALRGDAEGTRAFLFNSSGTSPICSLEEVSARR